MNDKPDSPPGPGEKSLLQLVGPLLVVLIGVALWRGLPQANGSEEPASGQTVVGDSVVYLEVTGPELDLPAAEAPWREGLTVRDATERALPSVWRNEGAMSFLDEMGGVPNQADKGLFWQFEVNGEYSQRGAGDFALEPGDRVLWKLAPYE